MVRTSIPEGLGLVIENDRMASSSLWDHMWLNKSCDACRFLWQVQQEPTFRLICGHLLNPRSHCHATAVLKRTGHPACSLLWVEGVRHAIFEILNIWARLPSIYLVIYPTLWGKRSCLFPFHDLGVYKTSEYSNIVSYFLHVLQPWAPGTEVVSEETATIQMSYQQSNFEPT